MCRLLSDMGSVLTRYFSNLVNGNWHSPSGCNYKTVKTMANGSFDRSGAPAFTWLLCLMYRCLLLNHMSSPSLGHDTYREGFRLGQVCGIPKPVGPETMKKAFHPGIFRQPFRIVPLGGESPPDPSMPTRDPVHGESTFSTFYPAVGPCEADSSDLSTSTPDPDPGEPSYVSSVCGLYDINA